MATLPVTAKLAENQNRARQNAQALMDAENHGANTLVAQDDAGTTEYRIYIYNVLDMNHVVNQPPLFPALRIPACPKGQKFSFTVIPAYVNEPYEKPGTTERYYKRIDGRKCATSLLNPSAYPGIKWESQIQNWDSIDQQGNNLNKYGVFWSLTMPDSTDQLDEEIRIFKNVATETMNELVKLAEQKAASGDLKGITPLMHFAMDYFGKQAQWHMTSEHKISCPNCGDLVKEGIAYHRNSFNEKCVIDPVRYREIMKRQREIDADLLAGDEDVAETAYKKQARKAKEAPAAG